jgi:hypothetical protein
MRAAVRVLRRTSAFAIVLKLTGRIPIINIGSDVSGVICGPECIFESLLVGRIIAGGIVNLNLGQVFFTIVVHFS